MAAFLLPFPLPDWGENINPGWPRLKLEDLPSRLGEVLSLVAPARVNSRGYLEIAPPDALSSGPVPQVQTEWNIENSNRFYRLETGYPWGIVLHWFGERDTFPGTIGAYLNGFNSVRDYGEVKTRTSAHFLVGPEIPRAALADPKDLVGILQTQAPDSDGTPFVAAHVTPVNQDIYQQQRQYFVKALNSLEREDPGVHSLLQDFYARSRVYPNLRTIGIEIAGRDFDLTGRTPPNQQIANVVCVVWALMERYSISAMNLLGHQELDLAKPDPGKKFMALIRLLIAAKALVEGSERMNLLVFGSFLDQGLDFGGAVSRYFKYIYDYLAMVGMPRRIYEWEAESKYWHLFDRLMGRDPGMGMASRFEPPLQNERSGLGNFFLDPHNHEGIDLYPRHPSQRQLTQADIKLLSTGDCLYIGESQSCSWGKLAMFRHRQPDGAEVVSVYGHLSSLADLTVGQRYPPGYRIGSLLPDAIHPISFLHFAVAYGATWRSYLSNHPVVPLNAGTSWICERYCSPMEYLQARLDNSVPRLNTLHSEQP